eukprot:366483-Chlamydomonas_euryale.AAC.4
MSKTVTRYEGQPDRRGAPPHPTTSALRKLGGGMREGRKGRARNVLIRISCAVLPQYVVGLRAPSSLQCLASPAAGQPKPKQMACAGSSRTVRRVGRTSLCACLCV